VTVVVKSQDLCRCIMYLVYTVVAIVNIDGDTQTKFTIIERNLFCGTVCSSSYCNILTHSPTVWPQSLIAAILNHKAGMSHYHLVTA
jgi:hypothetical protein